MFRSRRYPTGVMTRSRLDWAYDDALAVSVVNQNTGGFFTAASLFNNATDGRQLALMALLVWNTLTPQFVSAYMVRDANGTVSGTPNPLRPNQQIGPGLGYAGFLVTPPLFAMHSQFIADGTRWLTLPNAPLAIIPPGWRYEIATGAPPNGVQDRAGQIVANFIWIPI